MQQPFANPLPPDNARRFGGIARLYGAAGAQALAQAHVAVVGIGGVGSWAAEALARSGVGRITLVDMDHVAESNINRQLHATDRTLGQAKVQAMCERIASYHPACQVSTVDDFVEPDNWPALLPAPVDAVIDACDQMRAKVAMAAWARHTATPFICSGAAGGKQQPWLVEVADLAHVTHDPLLAQLRARLRKHHQAPSGGKAMQSACVFSREAVRQNQNASCSSNASGNASGSANASSNDGSLNCHGYGSSVGVTATFGMCAAAWVMQQLAARRGG